MRSLLKFIFPILFIALIIIGINNTEIYSNTQDLERLSTTCQRLCLKYYASEGYYPSNIEELKKYGLSYDESRYVINYHKEGDNILPSIQVYRKEKIYE